ncbi:MAG: hypothetical protein QOG35_763 [Solirubrobacteraceae bacterium]|nr:hypothetical protein [Solirubrobacteraceae bacterium]
MERHAEEADGPRIERVRAVAPLQQSNAGGSGSFLVRADDGCRYWCKVLNNAQGDPKVPVNEQIVGWLGSLIGIAVCEPRLVEIPEALADWEFRPGHHLQSGWAHGGLAVEGAIETRTLDHRTSDNNSVRHAGFYALHDWLGGADPQWLYASADEQRYYSHDHGHYFWGPSWTPATLSANVGTAAPLGVASAGLDPSELERLADRLDSITEQEVAGALPNFPEDWPIDQSEIRAVVDFATQRCSQVAQRIRSLPT